MDHILSPDLPAYICYGIVLALGVLVARATVNSLLAAQLSRWGDSNTWALFAAHTALPVVLFWFLDYTSALSDSSLFGALVVAFGYKQIFAGGVQGITMPGQTPRLWQPFEAWVSQIKESIVTKDQKRGDLFNTRVRVHIAGSPDRLQQLRDLAFANTKDPTGLSSELATLQATPLPASASAQSFAQWLHTEEVQTLLADLRKSEPSSYDVLLRETKMLKWWMSRGFRKSTRSRVAAWLVPIALLLIACVGVWLIVSDPTVALKYGQWRFTKGNASAMEHFRAQEYLLGRIGQAAQKANGQDEIGKIVLPLALKLRFKEISPRTAEDILALIVESQSCKADPVVIPELIEALRNPNDAIRLQTLRSLSRIRENHYPGVAPPEADQIPKWIPNKDESAISIDQHVRNWENWWATTATKAKCQ